jgi:RHS repeat-associated protein
VQQLSYGWRLDGELDHRDDLLHSQSEAFAYDDLRRLTQATVTHGAEQAVTNVSYDAVGNILGKSDVGGYAYDDGRLLAYGTGVPVLLGHDDRGNVITHGSKALTYTPFDKLRQLTDHGQTLDFRYDADGDRFSRSSPDSDELIVDVRGLYERKVDDGELTLTYRVPADGRIVAQIVRTPGLAGVWIDQIESLHDDHLSSTHVVTDEAGDVVRTVAYDPWGQARDGDDWLVSADPEELEALGLGFTGHPARLDADLVDMGGRSYHPRLGRFFSPDPVVVAPLDAQAWNRYAYVRNRPLVATDPTGYEEQGLGSNSGSSGSDLPRSCADGPECYRFIVVADPDGTSALDQWNRTLQFFDGHNGPGQGGPGSGGGNPYSPNGVRHGTDAGQPGGSPAFTIAVTPDMCAVIAACSGRQSKKAPVYIWHAPVDDWAATAADLATDAIPGVTHLKTAYDAYQRIQSGEDPVDILMAVGGDALLGLIPGGKLTKKLDKALDKAENVADAAGSVKGHVLKRDLTKGPHAPDTPIGKVIDRAQSTGKPQGRWSSTDAAERAAGRARPGQKTVPIAPGDGTVVHALRNGGVMIREANQAVTVPKKAGNKPVWHTYPVD